MITDNLYLYPFLIALISSVLLSVFLIWVSKKLVWKRRGGRHIHLTGVSRLGGLAIAASFFIALYFENNLVITDKIWGFIFASLLLIFMGIWDDFRELEWKNQLFFQVAAIMLIFITGTKITYITNPFGGVIDFGQYSFYGLFLIMAWILFVLNSMNWLDGIDGLSSGVALVAVITIFLIALKPEVNQPPVGILAMSLAGSILGFLIFNFHPAKIIAGTNGILFMGFSLAFLSIFAGTKIATTLLVMAVPIIDTFWVIFERIKSGQPIYMPDKKHFHFKLMELGWSQRKISLSLYGVTILIAIIAFKTKLESKMIAIIVIALVISLWFILINKKLRLIKKNENK